MAEVPTRRPGRRRDPERRGYHQVRPGVFDEASFDTGLGAGLVGGYSYDIFRLEGELFYKSNDVDKISSLGVSLSGDGDVTAMGVMINAYYDFKTGTPFTPYIGAGIGFAQVSANDVGAFGVVLVDDDDTVFAYQAIAGVGYSISNALTLDLMYKYFATTDPEFNDVVGDPIESEYSSHNVMVGLRFNY
jgi:opacity protein-like surface antigen